MVEDSPPKVHSFRRAQISSAIAETVTLPETYKDFEDIFSVKNTSHLPPYKEHDHAIDLVYGKQPRYRPIDRLLDNKLSILRAYIDKNLVNRFIKSSMSPSDAPIFFLPKPNGGLLLYINKRV